MSKNRTVAATLVVAALMLAACRPLAPVVNVNNASYGSYANTALTLDDYERAIVRAGTKRNWVFNRLGPGHLEGRTTVRGKHSATVDVLFNTQTYSINYKSSQNLKYDAAKGEIHPNYNSWITLLDNDIKAEIQRMQAT